MNTLRIRLDFNFLSAQQDEISASREQLSRQERLTDEIRDVTSKDRDEATQTMMQQVRGANEEASRAIASFEQLKAETEKQNEVSLQNIRILKTEIVRYDVYTD